MDLYVETRALFPRATMHYVGHSNGTYLAASALEDYPAARFGNIYFAGSVVNPGYKWQEKIDQHRISKFHNARGATDWVVALLPKSLEYFTDLGGGGFDGFDETETNSKHLTQSKRFAKGGHSGAIQERHWPEIAEFIVSGTKPFSAGGEKDDLFSEKSGFWALLGGARIGIPFFFSLAAVVDEFEFGEAQ
jgi:pimeloyl-ACP methyl ester carboxylesterase